jgi:hypothetical protein
VIRPVPFLLVAAALALCAPPALAQHGQQVPRQQTQNAKPAAGFTAAQRDAIAAYFSKHPQGAKPLPPGIAKNLARGKPLPPGIAKRALPAELMKQIAPAKGFQVTICGDRVVLLEASGLVVDILEHVVK